MVDLNRVEVSDRSVPADTRMAATRWGEFTRPEMPSLPSVDRIMDGTLMYNAVRHGVTASWPTIAREGVTLAVQLRSALQHAL